MGEGKQMKRAQGCRPDGSGQNQAGVAAPHGWEGGLCGTAGRRDALRRWSKAGSCQPEYKE